MGFQCVWSLFVIKTTSALKANYHACSIATLLLTIPTALLNVSLIIALIKSNVKADLSYMFLLNLAVTDLIGSVVVMPAFFVAFNFIANSRNPCYFLKFISPVAYILGLASFVTVLLMSIERYIKIFHPFVYSARVTLRKTAIAIMFAWLYSAIPVLQLAFEEEKLLTNGLIFVSFLVGAPANIFCYFRIIWHARSIRRQITSEAARFGRTKISVGEKNVAKIGGLILISITVCYIPLIFLSVLASFEIYTLDDSKLFCWGLALSQSNCLLNPVISCIFNPLVKQKVLRMWRCRFFLNNT
eukprot:gene16255-7635_t